MKSLETPRILLKKLRRNAVQLTFDCRQGGVVLHFIAQNSRGRQVPVVLSESESGYNMRTEDMDGPAVRAM